LGNHEFQKNELECWVEEDEPKFMMRATTWVGGHARKTGVGVPGNENTRRDKPTTASGKSEKNLI